MNILMKELEEKLQAYVPTHEDAKLAGRAEAEQKEFVRRFPIEILDKLTPDTYCIGHGDKENFCWWIERGTHAMSRYFPGSSKSYGMFWEKGKNAFRMTAYVRAYGDAHPGAELGEILVKTVAEPLKAMVESHGANGTFEAVHSVGDGFRLKALILYYPDEFFQINSTNWIDAVIDKYGLEKPDSYVERNKVIRRFYEEKKLLVRSGDLTQQAFVGIVARQLGLTGPHFWHMQLHPGHASNLTRDQVLRLINDYGVIGMGRQWKNDGGQPRMFAEDVRDGDIVGIREGGFVALVRIAGPCRDNDRKDELCWFDIVRPVELLSDEADSFMAQYKESTKKNAHDNLYNPATLSPVHSRCKNKFLQFWYESVIDGDPPPPVPPPDPGPAPTTSAYGREEFLKDVYMTEAQLDELTSLLEKKKNIIMAGAPGVGKTYAAKRIAWEMMGAPDPERVCFVQFHQSYAYEDFICGYKPVAGGGFKLRDGVFYSFCKKAEKDPGRSYYLLIDEINRGNLSKIFGELLMLIEADKRGDANYAVRLAYRPDELFVVPENIYIIGMMNTADRSLAMMDYALRRRFSFFAMTPGFDTEGFKASVADDPKMQRLVAAVKSLNVTIRADISLGKGFVIGHSYFCGESTPEEIVRHDIGPTLEEYWFDNPAKAEEETEKLLDAIR